MTIRPLIAQIPCNPCTIWTDSSTKFAHSPVKSCQIYAMNILTQRTFTRCIIVKMRIVDVAYTTRQLWKIRILQMYQTTWNKITARFLLKQLVKLQNQAQTTRNEVYPLGLGILHAGVWLRDSNKNKPWVELNNKMKTSNHKQSAQLVYYRKVSYLRVSFIRRHYVTTDICYELWQSTPQELQAKFLAWIVSLAHKQVTPRIGIKNTVDSRIFTIYVHDRRIGQRCYG